MNNLPSDEAQARARQLTFEQAFDLIVKQDRNPTHLLTGLMSLEGAVIQLAKLLEQQEASEAEPRATEVEL